MAKALQPAVLKLSSMCAGWSKSGTTHKPKYWPCQFQNGNQARMALPMKPGICKPMGDSTMASPISTHSQWFRHTDAHLWSQLIALSVSEHSVYICQLSTSLQTLRSHLTVEGNILVWTLRRCHCLLWRGCHSGRLRLVGWLVWEDVVVAWRGVATSGGGLPQNEQRCNPTDVEHENKFLFL